MSEQFFLAFKKAQQELRDKIYQTFLKELLDKAKEVFPLATLTYDDRGVVTIDLLGNGTTPDQPKS